MITLVRGTHGRQASQQFRNIRQFRGWRPFRIGEIGVNDLQPPTGTMFQCPGQPLDSFKLAGQEVLISTTIFSPSRRAIMSGAKVRKNSGSSRGEGSTETW